MNLSLLLSTSKTSRTFRQLAPILFFAVSRLIRIWPGSEAYRFSLRHLQTPSFAMPLWVFLTKTAKSQFVSKNSDLSPAHRPRAASNRLTNSWRSTPSPISNAVLCQIMHRINQMTQVATESIEFPDHQNIAGAKGLERGIKAGTSIQPS